MYDALAPEEMTVMAYQALVREYQKEIISMVNKSEDDLSFAVELCNVIALCPEAVSIVKKHVAEGKFKGDGLDYVEDRWIGYRTTQKG